MRAGKRLALAAAASLPALAWSAPAAAGCTIATTPVAFGIYNPQSATALDGSGTVTTVCDSASANTVRVGIDGGGSGNINARRMTSGASNLSYQLYRDAARTQVWGNAGTQRLSYTGRNRTVVSTIYGRIPALQNVAAGVYLDTLIVTVEF